MIDNNTKGICKSYERFNKPHIYYCAWTKGWLCTSEDGPWDICMGSGETPKDAYICWEKKVPKMNVETPNHWIGPCQDGGKWRLE